MLIDPENFLKANLSVTPVHIQPEWYFLFAYAILRSIPNKLGGVLALGISIMILYLVPFISNLEVKGFFFIKVNRFLFWCFVVIFFLLIWIGASVVEYPYIMVGQVLSVVYFLYFFVRYLLKSLQIIFLK